MNKEAAVESTRPEELIRPTDETSECLEGAAGVTV